MQQRVSASQIAPMMTEAWTAPLGQRATTGSSGLTGGRTAPRPTAVKSRARTLINSSP